MYVLYRSPLIVSDLGGYVIALWTIASVIVVILLLLMVKTTIYVNKVAPKPWRRKIVWISAVYPVGMIRSMRRLSVGAIRSSWETTDDDIADSDTKRSGGHTRSWAASDDVIRPRESCVFSCLR